MTLKSDALRRGIRTLIDVLLAGGSSGLIVLLLHVFGVEVSAEQFAALMATLTPVLSVVKNALEDSKGTSFLVDKTRPEPDPVTSTTLAVAEGEDTTAAAAQGETKASKSEAVMFASVPEGMVLIAVERSAIQEGDTVVGYTR